VASDDDGWFRIITLPNHTLLRDSRTGDNWMLTTGAKEGAKLHWVEVPRLRNGEKREAEERAADDSSKPGNKEALDPFLKR